MQGDPFDAAYDKIYGPATSDPFDAAYDKIYGKAVKPEPNLWGRSVRGAKEIAGGFARGAGESLTSYGALAGMANEDLGQAFASADERLAALGGEEGVGYAGRVAGRLAGEIAQAALGGGIALKGAAKLAKGAGAAAKAAQAVQRGLTAERALTRALSTAAVNAPVDVLQGLKGEEGLVLPGRAGSVAENVLFSGAAGALPVRKAKAKGVAGDVSPAQGVAAQQQAQVRGLLPSTTTTTEEVLEQGIPGMPPLRTGRRAVVREPLTPEAAKANIQQGPAIPMGGGPEWAQRQAEAAAEAADELAGKALSDRASAWDMPLDELEQQVRARPFPRSEKAMQAMPDDDLLNHLVYRTRVAEDGGRAERMLEEMEQALEEAGGGRPMGVARAKALYGGDAALIRQRAQLSEDQMEEFFRRGLDAPAYFEARASALRSRRGSATLARVEKEAERRGLSIGRDVEATDFNPAMFSDPRAGLARTQVISTLAGGGTGALAGAAGAEEGDRGAGAVLGGAIGAGLGLGVGRVLAGGTRASVATEPSAIPKNIPEAISTRRTPETPMRTTPLAGPIKADDYLNIERIAPDNPRVQELLRNVTEDAVRQTEVALRRPGVGGKRGRLVQPETFADLRAQIADDLKVDVADVVERTAQGDLLTRQDLARVRAAQRQSVEQEAELVKRLQAGAFAAPEDRALAEQALQQVRQDHFALTNTLIKQSTEAGRNLNALKMAALDSTDPSVWVSRLQQLAGRTATAEEIAQVWDLASQKNVDGLVELGKEMQKFTPWEKFRTLYKAGLLTQPKTHLANLGGNSAMWALESAKDIPAVLIDQLVSTVTGVRTKSFNIRGLSAASYRGARKGIEDAKRVWKTGQSLDPSGKWTEAFREVSFDNPILDVATKKIFRSLEASDQIFTNLAIARSIDEQARVLSRGQGELFRDQLLKNPTAQMQANALADALYATFKDNSALAVGAMKARNVFGKAGDVLMPFTKTPANIAGRIVDYSPLGLTSALGRLVFKGVPDARAQKRLVEDIARGSLGSALVVMGYLGAKNGRVSGFFPFEERERNRAQMERRQEGSILVDGRWVQVNRISPLGNLLTVGAAMADAEKNDGTAARLFSGLLAPASSVVDLPMVSSLNDLLTLVRDFNTPRAGKSALEFTGGVARSFVPSAVRGTAYGIDPLVRETRSNSTLMSAVVNPILAATPGLSMLLPERLDAFGRPINRGAGPEASVSRRLAESLANPMAIQRDARTRNPIVAELSRTGAVVAPVSRRANESAAAFNARQRAVGSRVERALVQVMALPAYRAIGQMPTERLRAALAQADTPLEGVPDEQLRSRYQGYLLERAAERAKTAENKRFPDPAGGRRGALTRALTR